MKRPSFIATSISGIIIFVAFILFIINFKLFSSDPVNLINTLLFLGISFGLHAVAHYYEEIYYDFNPFIGKWIPKDEPKK